MKVITWDATKKRLLEVVTGRVFTQSTTPPTIADGDLWVDTTSTPVLKGKVSGVVYELAGQGYLENIDVSYIDVDGSTPNTDIPTVLDNITYPYATPPTQTPTVVLF